MKNMREVSKWAEFEAPSAAQSMIDGGMVPVTAYRTARAMSVMDLAAASGVAPQRIENFEAAMGDLLEHEFEALGKALAVAPWVLKSKVWG
jgi:hypothetical protein